jgi:hypothetical protein
MLQTLTTLHTCIYLIKRSIFETSTEKLMKKIFSSSLLALSLASAALLSACGGGGDSATPEQAANQPAWGSPAMFVPAGQSQVSVAVSDCSTRGSSGTTINTPSLVITSAGDVIFSGAVSPATTITELARLNFADTSYRTIEFNSDPISNGFYVENVNEDDMTVTYNGGGKYFSADFSNIRIFCNTVADLTPAYAPSEARLAAKFTAAATVWGNEDTRGTSTISNSLFAWDNKAQNSNLDSSQTSVRWASLNVATGALSVGPSSSQITQSVALSAASANDGSYIETDSADPDFVGGRSKEVTLRINTLTQGLLKFNAYAGDNIIIVRPQLGNFIIGPPPILPPAAPL